MKNSQKNTLMNVLLVVLFMLMGSISDAQEQDILKYEVGVTAKTIPVFAVDAKENPVYDLGEKDIQLFVNGKSVPFEFLKYNFDQQVETIKKLKPQKDRRVIFIVLDSMFNSEEGFHRSREIVREFVQKRFKGNRFVLLENTAWGGLRYLVGPETDETKIMTAVEQLKWFPEKKRKLLFMKPTDKFMPLLISWYMDVAYSTPRTSPIGGFDPNWEKKKIRVENKRFRQKAQVFAEALDQFKYVLQSSDDPKLVFLISEGFTKEKGVTTFKREYSVKTMTMKGAFREFSLYYLSRIISGINASGSVLYTINPQLTNPGEEKIMTDGGAVSMKYAAEASGGKYFEGENVASIVKEIKHYTAAYYEVAFSLTPEMGERQLIQLKCNRNGITLHTVRQSERAKPYHAMNKLEKKLFAYNAVSGGTWSRVTGKVKRAVYKIEENRENNTRTINVEIPSDMKNKKLDIFLLQFNPRTQDLVVDLERRTVKDRENIQFKAKEDTVHFFVMIEPSQTLCIYGSEKSADKTADETYEDPDYYSANTPTTMMTIAGKLAVAGAWDGGSCITLNGEMIYNSSKGPLRFDHLYKAAAGDVVQFKDADSYALIIIETSGTYKISGQYETVPALTLAKGEFRINNQPVQVKESGKTSAQARMFYLFLDRFKADEEFQRSRVTFPFKRMTYNPETTQLLNTEEVSKKEWEFTMFQDSPDYAWSEPKIGEDKAEIELSGKQLRVIVVFERINGKWFLTHSEDRSVRNDPATN